MNESGRSCKSPPLSYIIRALFNFFLFPPPSCCSFPSIVCVCVRLCCCAVSDDDISELIMDQPADFISILEVRADPYWMSEDEH